MQYNSIVVLGATATGKTNIATAIAAKYKGEIISADSRQIYRGMDLGTGKDIEEYVVDGEQIPYHLIDIVDAGYKYNVFEYQKDFVKAFESISDRKALPIICGGTGMYLEAVLKGYKLIAVPNNDALREELIDKSLDELILILKSFKNVHNNSDVDTKKRAIRAIEIEDYYQTHEEIDFHYPEIKPLIIGIDLTREERRRRISSRLKARIDGGMIDEVKALLKKGVSAEDLIYYGLEYKFLTMYVIGDLSYDEMYSKLEIAIHQFAKRQMTWYRKMQRSGFDIHWIDGTLANEDKIAEIDKLWTNSLK